MKRLLKNLQKKPERVREQIALFAAGGVTILVIGIWALSLTNPFRAQAPDDGIAVQPEKPLQLFFGSLSDGLKEQRQDLKENNPFTQYDETNPSQEMLSDQLPPELPEEPVPEGTAQEESFVESSTTTTTELDTQPTTAQ